MKAKMTMFIVTVIGLACVYGSWYFYQEQVYFLNHSESAIGTVVDFDTRFEDGGTLYAPVVEFTTKHGDLFTFVSKSYSSKPSYHTSEKLAIKYLGSNPNEAIIHTFWEFWLAPIVLGGFGVLFTLLGIGFFIKRLKMWRLKRLLVAKGDFVIANVLSVDRANYTINNKTPFIIVAEWYDNILNKRYVFKSDAIWDDPFHYIPDGDVRVFIDLKDPKKYYMDTSFLPEVIN